VNKVLILWTLTTCVAELFALTPSIREARLLGLSTSGNTALMNIGSLEGIKEEDYAVLVKKVKDLDQHAIRLVPVAKARIIKVDKNRSFLVLFKQFEEKPKINVPYVLMTESDLLNGRQEWQVERKQIVGEPSKLAQNLKEQAERDKDSLSQKSQNYRAIHKNYDLDQKFNDEFVVTDVNKWNAINEPAGSEIKMPQSVYRSEYKEDFIQKKRLETFEKLVVNYLQKVNRPGFNYASFYYQSMRDPVFGEFREGLHHQSEYLAFLEEEAKRQSKDAYLYRQLLEKGQSWSEEFTDEELEGLLGRVGVIYEQERRRVLMSNRFRFQGHMVAGFNFLDNENRFDNENARRAKYHTELGVRFFPFNKIEEFNQIAFEGTLKYGVDGISLGIYNAQSTEYSGSFHLVYYPFASPYVVDKNSFYLAVGAKAGTVQLNVPSLGDSANYDIFALPTFQMGLIYNFISGYGLRISLSVEKSSLDKVGNVESTTSVLPQQTTLQEGRLSIGLTKFF
jgi:hypothetical protein